MKNVRVLVLTALSSTVALEVVDERGRVVSNVAEVDSLSALAEEEEAVEYLEELGGGLMDRADDRMSRCCEPAHESTDLERRLAVKTGSRLVQE